MPAEDLTPSPDSIQLTPNENSPKALFLDRDGTLIVDKGNLGDPEEVELIPGTAEALIMALQAGYRLFILTNQGGVGLGLFSRDEVEACHRKMFELLELPEGLFTAICAATESPVEPFTEQSYRKPSPRFIKDMIKECNLDPKQCFMIGDRQTDWEAARNAGIQGVAVLTGAEITDEQEAWLANNAVPQYRQLYQFCRTL